MNNYGEMTPGGFRPNEPDLDEILSRIGISSEGAAALEPSKSKIADDELSRAYARMARTKDGQLVLEDLLNMTLRASSRPDEGYLNLEQTAMAAVKYQSRADLVCAILARVVKGRDLPAPKSRKKKS